MQPVYKENKHGAIEQEFKVKPIIRTYDVCCGFNSTVHMSDLLLYLFWVVFIQQFNNPRTKKNRPRILIQIGWEVLTLLKKVLFVVQ